MVFMDQNIFQVYTFDLAMVFEKLQSVFIIPSDVTTRYVCDGGFKENDPEKVDPYTLNIVTMY